MSATAGATAAAPGWGRGAGVWAHRELLRSLVARNLKVKYQRSVLGFLWTLLNPLVTVLILVVVFSHVVRIQVPDYWAFLLSGYFVWNFTIQTLNAGAFVFAEHGRLVRSAAFPTSVLVWGASIARLLEFAAATTFVMLALVFFHHGGVPASFAVVPVLVAIQVVLVTGLTMPIAALSAFYYDVQHALPIALTTLFYVSPVFYPAAMVPEAFRSLYLLNPIAGLITLYHQALYDGVFPSPLLLGGTAAGAALLYLAGHALFDRYATVYAEIV